MTSEILTPSAKLSSNNNTNIITSAVAHSQVSPNFINIAAVQNFICLFLSYLFYYTIYRLLYFYVLS